MAWYGITVLYLRKFSLKRQHEILITVMGQFYFLISVKRAQDLSFIPIVSLS